MKKTTLQKLPRNVWVITVTSFLTNASSEMLVNLIPFFLANVLGVRFADRVGKGIRTAPRDALIANSIDKSQRGSPLSCIV